MSSSPCPIAALLLGAMLAMAEGGMAASIPEQAGVRTSTDVPRGARPSSIALVERRAPVVATSRDFMGGAPGALEAWNRTEEPHLDIIASRMAPSALWQGAGTRQGRDWLLRAYPLLEKGVLKGLAFGRDAGHSSVEYVRPVRSMLAVAGFLDVARAWYRQKGLGPSPTHVDAGVGARVRAPGCGGTFRIDVAHGLRDGGATFSANWVGGWPR